MPDGASNMCGTSFLKHKNHAVRIFKKITNIWECKSRHCIKTVCTDEALEFVKGSLLDHITDQYSSKLFLRPCTATGARTWCILYVSRTQEDGIAVSSSACAEPLSVIAGAATTLVHGVEHRLWVFNIVKIILLSHVPYQPIQQMVSLAVWSVANEECLILFLVDHWAQAGNGNNFKATVWQAAASHVSSSSSNLKTWTACKTK